MRLLLDKKLSGEVWRLAGPIVVGMVSQTLQGLVDTAMVGRLGANSLAAAGLGGMLSWWVLGALMALAIGTQAVSARRYGEGNHLEAGKTLDNSLVLAVISGLLCSALIAPAVRWIFPFFAAGNPEIVPDGQGYVFYRLLSGLPMMIIMAHRGFFNGVGDTKLHMRVALLVNGSNIVLNYFLIFGNMGAPELGTPGAGLATAIGNYIGAAYFIHIGLNKKRRALFQYYKLSNLDRKVMGGILKLTLTTSLHSFLVMAGFNVFNAVNARLGTVELAVTNVCITVMSISFMPGAGIGNAAATLLGQKLGEGNPELAESYGWESLRLGMYFMGMMGVIYLLFPESILRIFTEDPDVIRKGIAPIRIMGLVQFVDAAGIVFSFALEGVGMNRFVMITEVLINWGLFIPITLIFTLVFGWGLVGAWSALALYIIIFGTIMTIKFSRGGWKLSRV